ncbi:ATP Synthase B [Dirofilaria immitis]|nr:ATP Synthase B [Dirofilaria immitis]
MLPDRLIAKLLALQNNGIPLKGESHAPISFMRDIGKEYIPPPLPEMPKDFKEYPERDLVNYPYPVKRMYPPKLRLMIVPDKFMNNFHKYTGTSGKSNSFEVRMWRLMSKAERSAYAAVKEYYPVIFKENLALQLESTYRRNVERLATEMKRRLDYLQETEAVRHSFARDHMLKWIINSVQSEIVDNKENIKEKYMDTCIEQLKGLSLQ